MMLFGLALMAQSVTLPADNREAALMCGAAVIMQDDQKSIDGLIAATWFSLTSAMGTGPLDTLMDRSTDDLRAMSDRVDSIGKNAADYLAQCRKRFPLAWKSSGVTLPSDDYDRRAMCFSVGTVVSTYMERGDPKGSQRLADRVGALVSDDELDQRGLNDEAGFKREIGRVFALSLPLGNFAGVANACEKAYPG